MVTRCFPVAKIVGSSPIGVAYVGFLSWVSVLCILTMNLNFSGAFLELLHQQNIAETFLALETRVIN